MVVEESEGDSTSGAEEGEGPEEGDDNGDHVSTTSSRQARPTDVFAEFVPFAPPDTEAENENTNSVRSEDEQMEKQKSTSSLSSPEAGTSSTTAAGLLGEAHSPQSQSSSLSSPGADVPSSGFRRRSTPVTKNMRPDPNMIKMLKKIRDIKDEDGND